MLHMRQWIHAATGGESLGELLPSGQLYIFRVHAYSENPQKALHKVSIFLLFYTQSGVK